MHRFLLAAVVSAAAAGIMVPTLASAAAPLSCEKSFADVKAATAAAKLGDAGKAQVADLTRKGLERCKADDDQGADDYFAQAMKIVGK
jgi:hypothetical protein